MSDDGGINVLSLFDGIRCGMVALERAGIEVNEYYASEVDKYAVKIANANYPNSINLGDVQCINYQMLPDIDLLIGGSPCQGFSFAGKQLNFSDPRSSLFFEFVHALREVKTKYFILENVVMKQEYQDAISELLGCNPIKIDSSLVSAQNRKRLYWTNVINVDQPNDEGIFLEDVLHCKGNNVYQRGRGNNNGGLKGDKSPCMSSSSWEHNVIVPQSDSWHEWWEKNKDFQVRKKYSAVDPGKAITITARQYSSWNGTFVSMGECVYRKLTVTECERLQTLPDGYTQRKGVSNSQCYKALGNAWTVDVVSHILRSASFDTA